MKLLAILACIAAVVIIYFFLGICVKLLWGWLLVIIALPGGLVLGISGGWGGSIIGITLIIGAILVTDRWHSMQLFLDVEDKIDNLFGFRD